jgi:hypothetical protein
MKLQIPLDPPFSKGEEILLPLEKGGWEGFLKGQIFLLLKFLNHLLQGQCPEAQPVTDLY